MFSWEFPYPSQRMPVLAKNVVATSQPLAAQAGLAMLAQGGNAVDAGLAAAITLTVVEPTSNGIGSDAFAILWDGQRLVGLNASGRSPAGWTPERFAGRKRDAGARLGLGHGPRLRRRRGSRCRKRYGKLPFEDALRARHPLRARKLHGLADHGDELGAAGAELQGLLGILLDLPAQGPRAVSRASASTARSRPRRSRTSRPPRARASIAARSPSASRSPAAPTTAR